MRQQEQNTRKKKNLKCIALGTLLGVTASVVALYFDNVRHWAGKNLEIYITVDSVLLIITGLLLYRFKSIQNSEQAVPESHSEEQHDSSDDDEIVGRYYPSKFNPGLSVN